KESDDYVSQAQKTDNPSEKVALLEQARDLANSKKEKENQIQDDKKTLVQIHNEYTNLMAQAGTVDSISKASTPLASSDTAGIKKDIKNFTPPVVINNNPTTQPTTNPVATNNPETQPTNNPTTQPTNNPVATNNPQTQPTNNPVATNNPTNNPTTQPANNPTTQPTNNPVATNNPTNNPTTQPNNPPDTAGGDTNEVRIDTTGGKGVSSKDLVKIANNDARQQQEAAQTAKDDATKATEYASSELNQSQALDRQAQEIRDHANNIKNPQERQDSLDKAAAISEQGKEAGKKAIEAFQLASQMQSQAMVKQKEADEATLYTSKLDSALKSPDKAKAIKKLQEQRDNLDKQTESNPPPAPSPGDLVRIQARNLKQDSVEVVKHDSDLQKEADRLQKESDDYVSQAQKTDNPSEKVALLEQARDLANSKKEKENQIQDDKKTLVQIHNEYTNLMAQAGTVDSISKASTPLASSDT